MTNSTTGTLTRTASITMTDVRHVLWRIETDLRVLRAHHGLITAEYEQHVLADLLLFIYRSYVERIEFGFVDSVATTRKYAVRYALTRNWSGEDDDDAGGLRYQDLRGTLFKVLIWYSPTWKALPPRDKAAFLQTLKIGWGPVADIPDGAGSWAADRTYGSGGLGATRSVFRSY